MEWTAEALELLEKIPIFVRPMAKKKIETKAEEEGITEITPEFMQKVREEHTVFFTRELKRRPPGVNPPLRPFCIHKTLLRASLSLD